jgi:hypothetical protein
MIKGIIFASNYIIIPTNNIAAEVHLAKGQFLLEERTLKKSPMY